MKSLPLKDHHKAEKKLKDDQKTLPSQAELLLLLSHFSRVRLWSGLPFPSPMHESEK